jgi:hypothetical protein
MGWGDGGGLPRHRLIPQPGGFDGFEGGRSALPVEHLDSNPVGVEGEERVIARLVAILLRREVNVCATREAACMRLINLLPSVNLEGEVLDADVVVAVGTTVGWTQAETTVTDCSWSRKVDDLLRTSVGGIPDLLDPAERPEQVEIEGEGPLNVGDGQIDVMDSSRCHGCVPLSRLL